MKVEGELLEEKVEADGPVHGGKRAEEEITMKVAHEDLKGRVLPSFADSLTDWRLSQIFII
jgi:hypothetical protein